MVNDVNRWNYIKKNGGPKRKGQYGLLCMKKSNVGNFHYAVLLCATWNKHAWDIPEEYAPTAWKFLTKKDLEKGIYQNI